MYMSAVSYLQQKLSEIIIPVTADVSSTSSQDGRRFFICMQWRWRACGHLSETGKDMKEIH